MGDSAMIPVKLSVRNFMCYRGDGAVLDLDGVHLACLSGENGAGKSALLGAITWALWGKARDRVKDDELISQGATEMSVEFEFILAGWRYRAIRKCTVKGGKPTTLLEIQMQTADGDDSWKALTGHHKHDTQEKITDLLKMDYDTFINSAFILQGRAAEFTVKTPADRKQVLADILGLGQYDDLEKRAREEARDRAAKAVDLENKVAGIDRELLLKPGYVKDLEELDADLTVKQAVLVDVREE